MQDHLPYEHSRPDPEQGSDISALRSRINRVLTLLIRKHYKDEEERATLLLELETLKNQIERYEQPSNKAGDDAL